MNFILRILLVTLFGASAFAGTRIEGKLARNIYAALQVPGVAQGEKVRVKSVGGLSCYFSNIAFYEFFVGEPSGPLRSSFDHGSTNVVYRDVDYRCEAADRINAAEIYPVLNVPETTPYPEVSGAYTVVKSLGKFECGFVQGSYLGSKGSFYCTFEE